MAKPLNARQKAYIAAYLGPEWLNKSGAARAVGATRARDKQELFDATRPAIDDLLAEYHLSEPEILALQAQIARLDLGPVITIGGHMDYAAFKNLGYTRFVKRIRPCNYGNDIEFHDAQRAQEKLLDHYAKRAADPLDVTLRFESIKFGTTEGEAGDEKGE